jgi:hypothetical protein
VVPLKQSCPHIRPPHIYSSRARRERERERERGCAGEIVAAGRGRSASVLEPGLLPDGVADAAEVAALERAPGALAHGEARGGALPALQQLVGRHPTPPAAGRAVLAVVVRPALRARAPGVLRAEDLGPVGDVHRQRSRALACAPARPIGGLRRRGHRRGPPVLLARGGQERRRRRGVGAAGPPAAPDDVRLVQLHALVHGVRGPRRREEPVRRHHREATAPPGHRLAHSLLKEEVSSCFLRSARAECTQQDKRSSELGVGERWSCWWLWDGPPRTGHFIAPGRNGGAIVDKACAAP